MSMHKIPLTPIEEAGLRAHGLGIGTPSQLSDAFRQGVRYARAQLPSQGGEAVGYVMTDAEHLRTDGRVGRVLWFGELTPGAKLYTHPADQVAEGVVVSRELLDSLLTVIDSNGYAADEVEVVDELRALLASAEGMKDENI